VRRRKYLLKVLILMSLVFIPDYVIAQSERPLLKLDLLIEEALQNNPEILASKKRSEIYREKIPQASALEDPMFGFGILSLPTNFSFRDEDMTMKEFSISQKFPFPGKRPLMKEMAAKEAESISTETEERSNRIIKEVKAVYYELVYLSHSIEITQKNKEILENFVKITETQYGLGMGIQQDLLKAHVEVSKMVDELIMFAQKKKALEAKLRALLNRPPDTPIGEPDKIALKKVSIPIEGLQKMVLDFNPSLKGMKKMIEAKEKAYALARREYYPDFNFRFAYGQRDNGPEMKRRDVLSGMMEINIPLFYKSKQDRKVAETKADIQNSEAQYQAMKNELLFMVSDMASMIQRIERQLELYQTGIIPQASLQIHSAMSAYRVNKADFMTLLDSQMTLYRYELEYHQAFAEHGKNVANLEWLIGRRLDQ